MNGATILGIWPRGHNHIEAFMRWKDGNEGKRDVNYEWSPGRPLIGYVHAKSFKHISGFLSRGQHTRPLRGFFGRHMHSCAQNINFKDTFSKKNPYGFICNLSAFHLNCEVDISISSLYSWNVIKYFCEIYSLNKVNQVVCINLTK